MWVLRTHIHLKFGSFSQPRWGDTIFILQGSADIPGLVFLFMEGIPELPPVLNLTAQNRFCILEFDGSISSR